MADPVRLLREAWERYRRPAGGHRSPPGMHPRGATALVRGDVGRRGAARDEGADVRAVTAWSLLGAYDWDSLSTRDDGHYESGVFDLRGPRPRPTALVPLLRDLAAGRRADHPVLDMPGWWHRPERLLVPWARPARRRRGPASRPMKGKGRVRPLMILGATGTLGRAFARLCDLRGLPYHLLSRHDVDITDAESVGRSPGGSVGPGRS